MNDAEYTKQLRNELELTQTEFANKFYFTDQQHVSKVEQGELNLTDLRRAYMELWKESNYYPDHLKRENN